MIDATAAQHSNKPTLAEHYAAWANWCHGIALFTREFEPALARLRKAQHIYQRIDPRREARVCISIAALCGQLGRYAEAESALVKAVSELGNDAEYPGRPGLFLNFSDIVGRQGRYAEMGDLALQAGEAAQQFEQPLVQAMAYINHALAQMLQGQTDGVEQWLERARTLSAESPELTARAAVNLSRLKRMTGELVQALQHLHQAREAFAAAGIEVDQATVFLAEADLTQQLHMPWEMQRVALQAAEICERVGLRNEAVQARIAAVRHAVAHRRFRAAQQQIVLAQRALPPRSTVEAAQLTIFAAYIAQRRQQMSAESAVDMIDRAAATLSGESKLEAERFAGMLASDGAGRLQHSLAQAKALSADFHVQQIAIALADKLPLVESTAYRQIAVDIGRKVQRTMPVEELKAYLLAGQSEQPRRLAESFLANGDLTAAMETLLVAKGAAWGELSAPPAGQQSGSSQRLSAELGWWRDALHDAGDADLRAFCAEKVDSLEKQLILAARLRQPQRTVPPLPTLEQVRAALPSDVVLLDYLVGHEQIHVFIIEHNKPLRQLRLGRVKSVQRLLNRFNLLIMALAHVESAETRRKKALAQLPQINELVQQIRAQLIAPLPIDLGSKLWIVPDDFLFELPWSALEPKRQLRLFTAATAVASAESRVTHTGKPLLLGHAGRVPLEAVSAELQAIEASVPNATSVLSATAAQLNGLQTAPRCLHIAAHGHINRRTPLLSALELADGDFHLADVMHLDLHGCEFAMLSACDTAAVPEHGGVLLALAGAFLVAGARTAIAALWPVDDAATRELVAALYAEWTADQPIVEALWAAQQALQGTHFSHPYYRDAFQPLSRIV